MTARFDLLFVPPGGGYALSDTAPRAILGGLAARRLIMPFEERVGLERVEIYSRPSDAAHTLLGKGTAPDEAAFLELVLRFGTPQLPPFGFPSKAHFWLEIRGALKAQIDGRERQRLNEILGCRLQVFSREHTGIPDRPEFEPRPIKEAPAAPASGPIGCRVEDL